MMMGGTRGGVGVTVLRRKKRVGREVFLLQLVG